MPTTLFYVGSYLQAFALAVPPAWNAFPSSTNPSSPQSSLTLQELPDFTPATVFTPGLCWICLWGAGPQSAMCFKQESP